MKVTQEHLDAFHRAHGALLFTAGEPFPNGAIAMDIRVLGFAPTVAATRQLGHVLRTYADQLDEKALAAETSK